MTHVRSPCFGGRFHYVGAANRIPITWLDSVRVGVCLGVAVSFFDRVQEEEDEALSWHCASGEEGRAEM